MSRPLVWMSPVSREIPFDNGTNGFNALNAQVAIEEAHVHALFGGGTDGDVSLAAGTTTLTRTMYYNNLTLSGTAVLNPNGYKIYVRGTLSISGSASINASGANGGNGVGNTAGAAGIGINPIELGLSGSGTPGVTQNNDATDVAGPLYGYGAAGSNGGSGGGNANSQGNGGSYVYVPHHVISHNHIYVVGSQIYKTGGNGGGGGGGGTPGFLGTAGAYGANAASHCSSVVSSGSVNSPSTSPK